MNGQAVGFKTLVGARFLNQDYCRAMLAKIFARLSVPQDT
jgi:hypothetical protein